MCRRDGHRIYIFSLVSNVRGRLRLFRRAQRSAYELLAFVSLYNVDTDAGNVGPCRLKRRYDT